VTGNVYVLGACNELTALSNDGKILWSRALTDEFGAWTTHGGRTTSPIIEGDLVIVGTIIDGWGDTAQRRHRFYAFDKRTGECVWTSAPGGRPYDTVYPTPIAATINGIRMIIVGGADGAVYAMKAQTGEPVWSYAITKRGINNCAVIQGNTVFASHSEENLDTNEMGLLAAIDATGKGALGKATSSGRSKACEAAILRRSSTATGCIRSTTAQIFLRLTSQPEGKSGSKPWARCSEPRRFLQTARSMSEPRMENSLSSSLAQPVVRCSMKTNWSRLKKSSSRPKPAMKRSPPTNRFWPR
jgi:hypothetical protein